MKKQSLVLFVIGIVAIFSGCAGSQSEPEGNLDGLTFFSESKREVGLGPDGTVKDYWSFNFNESDFSWQHSDYGEGGTYRLNSETELKLIFQNLQSENENSEFTVELNKEQTEFVFEGMTYIREDVHEKSEL